MPKAAQKRSRRGAKIRNGSASSMKNTAPVANLSAAGAICAAYQASGVGSGWVTK